MADECNIHIKRVDDLEQRVEAHHVRIHKQDNAVTGLRMGAELLSQDVQHFRDEVRKTTEANRDAAIELRKIVEAQARVAQDDREKRLRVEADVSSHGRTIKWVISSATAIGVGCAIAVIAHFATKS